MKLFKFALFMLLGLLAGARVTHGQPTPTLSISLIAPTLAELSWPSNFAGWQLVSSTNSGVSASWQAVPGTPLPMGNSFVMFSVLTNNSLLFRLQLGGGGGGGGTFQATPPVILPGGSSTLSWRVDPNTTYQLLPGPGPVAGSNYVVSPTDTTVYTLIASNFFTFNVTSQQTTVTVATASCDFAGAKGWDCTLSFSYLFSPSSADYIFTLQQEASLTFHLTPSSVNNNFATFTGPVGGTPSLNDFENALAIAPPNNITTVVGLGPLLDPSSVVHLHVNCLNGTYSFDLTPVMYATWTQGNGSQYLLTTIGSVFVNNRALPASFGPLDSAGTESLPAHSVAWMGGGDFYLPGGLGSAMFASGVVTETTAGSVRVSWTFTPSP